MERLPDGTEHRTGVWIANHRQRRERLARAQLTALPRTRSRVGAALMVMRAVLATGL